MDIFLVYLVIGVAVGILAGLFGVGGGLVIVPALVFVFARLNFSTDLIVHLAVGTSLATIIFTSVSSIYAHHKRGAVLWNACWQLTPGIILGAALGAMVADAMPALLLRRVFAFFEWLVAAQLLLNIKSVAARTLPGRVGMSAAGTVIGSVSSIIGMGGGTLTVPFLMWCNVVIQRAVATSSACGLPIAIAGSISFILTGWDEMAILPSYATGYVYWPAVLGITFTSVLFAPLGAALAHRLPAEKLRRNFGFFLIVLGAYMFIKT